jgi:transcriptional regulator with XRE-family HTH domain
MVAGRTSQRSTSLKVMDGDVRSVVDRVCARPDVLEACRKHDLGYVLRALWDNRRGISQGRLAAMTGRSQGRISEYINGKHKIVSAKVLQEFADGLGFPLVARRALGLASEPTGHSVVAAPRSGTSPLEAGLAFPDSPAEATEIVTRLWRAELEDPTAPQQRRLDPRAWDNAALHWLAEPAGPPGNDTLGQVRIGLSDVQRFRTTVEMFAQLDDQFGGGHARQALIQYLSTDANRLLRGRYSDVVARELFSAVGEATLLAAWMTYDSTPTSGLAQRYFVQALGLAHAGDDRLLGASVLDAMSHQATYTHRFSEAANLARAARSGTRGLAMSTLTAHFHTMEARAHARRGDAKGCDRALADAVREFERRNPANDPQWIRYFSEVELNLEFGHCLRDLGRSRDAAQYAGHGFVSSADDGNIGRSDFFASIVLADAHLGVGEVEQACAVTLKALSAGEQIRSARCVDYLREFNRNLRSVRDSTAARRFFEQVTDSRLWRIATRSSGSGS